MREFNGSNETREDAAMRIKKEYVTDPAIHELIEAAEALMKIDFHDEIFIESVDGFPHGVSTIELVKAKAKMDGALRKVKL